MPQPESSFGALLRRFRVGAGLSQQQLGDAAGMDRTYIGRLEADEHSPSLDTICRVARGLNVDPRDLIVCPDAEVAS